jgi:dolichol-phosphate mannosyltransferase
LAALGKILVFTATYNEVENIGELVRQVFEALPDCDMLVVDDNSPDGTGQLIEELKQRFPRLQTIHRPGKNGLGTAHKLAIKFALAQGYDALITMDADFSHHPKYLPEMAKRLESAEFVIGSRYVPGGSCEYPLSRLVLSSTANFLTRTLLGIPLHETTTAYRGFRRALLERMNIDAIRSDGYSFFVESIFQVSRLERGAKNAMGEFPIRFEDRRAGTTKISKIEILNGMKTLGRLAAQRAVGGVDTTPRAESSAPEICPVCGHGYNVEERPPATVRSVRERLRTNGSGPPSREYKLRCLGCGRTYERPPSAEQTSGHA